MFVFQSVGHLHGALPLLEKSVPCQEAFVGFPVFLKSMSVQHHFYQDLIEGSNVFFPILCVTKSWKLWLDHDLIPFEWHLDSGLVRRTAVRFQHFRGARFGIQLQVSAIASGCLGLTKRTTFLRLQHGLTFKGRIQSPRFSQFFLGDFCWFLTGGLMMCPF